MVLLPSLKLNPLTMCCFIKRTQKCTKLIFSRYLPLLTLSHFSVMLFLVFITLAGTPATIECDGISFTTTAFAPIITSSPIVTPPITLAPAFIPTLSLM